MPTGNILETPELGTPLYNRQNFGSQWCPLLKGSTVINSMLPGLVVWNETMHAKYEKLNTFVVTMHLLANCSHVNENPKNAVGTYCGSEDRLFIGH